MRMGFVLCFLLAAFSIPAAAGDLKQDVEKITSAYAENFNKQDSAGIAALFAAGGVHVNPMGPRTDIAELYQAAFKAGFNHEDITVDQVLPLGADGVVALGEYSIAGKKQSGEPLEINGRWSAAYVREGGSLKIRMLSAFPKAQPSK